MSARAGARPAPPPAAHGPTAPTPLARGMAAVGRTLALALMWAALWGDLSAATLLVGVVIALGVQVLFRSLSPRPGGVVAPLAAVRLLLVFTWMLITSNVAVLKRVLAPRISLHPMVVDIDLPHCSDAVATVVANAITLTPGTLTLDLTRHDDGVGLTVHNLDATDADAVRADVHRLYDLVAAAFPAGSTPRTPSATPRTT